MTFLNVSFPQTKLVRAMGWWGVTMIEVTMVMALAACGDGKWQAVRDISAGCGSCSNPSDNHWQ